MLSVICVAGATNASADTDRVALYSIDKTFDFHYNGTSASYQVLIQTRGNASDEAVSVRYLTSKHTGIWRDSEATLVTTLNDGSKIWKAGFATNDVRFAIKYVANGVEYWNNNNGSNFTEGVKIGTAPIVATRNQYQWLGYDGNYRIDALLQNYAYNKNVFVRYTTDGWNTYADKALSYDKTNADGTEAWTTTIPVDESLIYDYGTTEGFEYAICYQVNGQTYWANNFGANYDKHFVIGG